MTMDIFPGPNLLVNLQATSASLGADVLLTSTTTYFDGPSVAQGSGGTWYVSGTVTLTDTASAATIVAKLWDGTNIVSSSAVAVPSGNFASTLALSGFISSPAGNLRISCKDIGTASGKILFNASGNSKDSSITAMRVA